MTNGHCRIYPITNEYNRDIIYIITFFHNKKLIQFKTKIKKIKKIKNLQNNQRVSFCCKRYIESVEKKKEKKKARIKEMQNRQIKTAKAKLTYQSTNKLPVPFRNSYCHYNFYFFQASHVSIFSKLIQAFVEATSKVSANSNFHLLFLLVHTFRKARPRVRLLRFLLSKADNSLWVQALFLF
jgi:hypothetical protein